MCASAYRDDTHLKFNVFINVLVLDIIKAFECILKLNIKIKRSLRMELQYKYTKKHIHM